MPKQQTLTLPKNQAPAEEPAEPGRQVGGGSTYGTGNDDMIARRNVIADGVDAARDGDLVDIEDDGESAEARRIRTDPENEGLSDADIAARVSAQNRGEGGDNEKKPPDDTQADDGDDEASAQTHTRSGDHPDLTRPITRKVNGKDVTHTLEDWLTIAQKVESGDEHLRAAGEAVRNAAELALSGNADEPAEDEKEKARALARAIQMGTEDEATQAVLYLYKPRPSATPDVKVIVKQELSARDAVKAKAEFEQENQDLFADEKLTALVFEEDKKLHAANPDMPYTERWQKAAGNVRDWAKGSGLLKSSKAARKAQVTTVRTAAGRQQPVDDQEPSDAPSDVIAEMAAKRGQTATAH